MNWMSDLPAEGEHHGAFKGGRSVDRPGGLASPLRSGFLQCTQACFVPLWPRAPRGCTVQMLSSTPFLAWLIPPLDCFALSHSHAPLPHIPLWDSCKTQLWLPPMLVLCMWCDEKMLEGHPVIHHGACIVKLTQLPPSKHVLMVSTPLISKNKIKLRACNEFKYI
jgi:hypothetical protein